MKECNHEFYEFDLDKYMYESYRIELSEQDDLKELQDFGSFKCSKCGEVNLSLMREFNKL